MASKRKILKHKHRQPLASKKICSIVIAVFATILAIFAAKYGFIRSRTHWWLNSEIDRNNNDDQIKRLYDDLGTAIKPFRGDKFSLEPIFDGRSRWGTLNSGHYFGLKLSNSRSIETSLAWFTNEISREGMLNIRHLCDQNDRLKSYSWVRHDFHSFGQQFIEDEKFKLATSFIIDSQNEYDWQAQINITKTDENSAPLSVIQYVISNQSIDKLESNYANSGPYLNGGLLFVISGSTPEIGSYTLKIFLNKGAENLILSAHHSGRIDSSRLPTSAYLTRQMVASIHNRTRLFMLNSKSSGESNIIAYQLTINGPVTYTIEFAQDKPRKNLSNREEYGLRLEKKASEFDRKIRSSFPVGREMETLAKVALSNMLGSVGYFYGHAYIGSSLRENEIASYGPIQLLTAVPSRSFFPRGFLWDEGFHNLIISRWDPGLSNKIIKSWFGIMNINGWIPREVILGIESMRRVPKEFLVQRIANANPPAMFLVIEDMLDRNSLAEQTLLDIYPKLIKWYKWFETTQFGPLASTYRWRGRDELSVSMLNPKTLTSGLDDYPRASHPSTMEYHLDLRCWMALVSRSLVKLAHRMNDTNLQIEIGKIANELADNRLLNDLHWSDDHQMFCDYGLDSQSVELIKVTKTRPSSYDNGQQEVYQTMERSINGDPSFGCVPQFGYVSLFPMMMRVLDPDNKHLGILLSKLRDEEELWSNFGIRSLSKKSRYYMKYNTEHDKPYWRGAIWLNMNYLILSSLKHYSSLPGPYQDTSGIIFSELKTNLVNNTLKEFIKTNYIWENYDDTTGRGQGSHPFTGWSSLILLIMSSNL